MSYMIGGLRMPGSFGVRLTSAAPSNGTDEVQTLTVTASGGTYRLSFEGFWTAPLAVGSAAAAIQAALTALPSVGAGGIAVTGAGPFTLTFGGNLARKAVSTIGVDASQATGGTVTVVETTPGVDATHRGAPAGGLLLDIGSTTKRLFINTGTPLVPIWTVVGTQT
jgi:hypothetical protein